MDTPLNATAAPVCPQNGTAHDGTLLCHWANSPGGRGTLNIFWLCISTLGLCVWNAVHPDIPRPKTPGWRVFGKRVWMLFVGLFMPEMLVLVALGQLRQACNLLVNIDRETAAPTQFPWWMYLLESWRPKRRNPEYERKWWMRALLWCLRVPSTSPAEERHAPASTSDLEEGKIETSPQPVRVDEYSSDHAERLRSPRATDCGINAPILMAREASDTSQHVSDSSQPVVYGPPALGCEREHRWTLTHCFYSVMHGFVDYKGNVIDIDVYNIEAQIAMRRRLLLDEGNVIDLQNLPVPISRIALPFDNPNHIPDLSVEDIEDRGKAGVLAKSLLVWQLFVFLASCFARWDQSLPLSLLEITTIGHSLCSIIAMVLWWYKPHSVGEATVINRKSGPLPPPSNAEWRNVFSWGLMKDVYRAGVEKVMTGGDGAMDVPRTLTIITIAVLYGLPHLLGLSIHFPTIAEQVCWTIATFTVIGSPLVMCGIIWIGRYTSKLGRMEDVVDVSLELLFLILLALYPIASMFLVGESVRQIFALPVDSFREPQLTTYLPSFS